MIKTITTTWQKMENEIEDAFISIDGHPEVRIWNIVDAEDGEPGVVMKQLPKRLTYSKRQIKIQLIDNSDK